MRAQFAKTMVDVAEIDSQIVILLGDIGAFGQREFAKRYPERFYNFGIREPSMVGAAAGMALMGFIPVVHSITPFIIERCFEQIKDDFCYHELGANLVSVGGGIDYSALGATHHSYSDIAIIKSLPRTRIFTPGSPEEFDLLFKANYNTGFVNYFRLPDKPHGLDLELDKNGRPLSNIIKSGEGVTVVTMGSNLGRVIDAVESIKDFISCEVVYFNEIKNLKSDELKLSLGKTKNVVVVEDHNQFGGLGDEVLRVIPDVPSRVRFLSVAIPDIFLRTYGQKNDILKTAGIDKDSIINAIRKVVGNE